MSWQLVDLYPIVLDKYDSAKGGGYETGILPSEQLSLEDMYFVSGAVSYPCAPKPRGRIGMCLARNVTSCQALL